MSECVDRVQKLDEPGGAVDATARRRLARLLAIGGVRAATKAASSRDTKAISEEPDALDRARETPRR